MLDKPARSQFPLHDLIQSRWSPIAYDSTPLTNEQIGSLLEAARWAPSCFNDQPWRFVVAAKGDAHYDKLASTIVEGNAWALEAPLLVLSVASEKFSRNGKPNRHAQYDVGLAVENMVIQAQSMGLVVHQMGGFDADAVRRNCNIPEDHTPMAMIAIGKQADPSTLPEDQQGRERAPRERRPLDEIAFTPEWGTRFL